MSQNLGDMTNRELEFTRWLAAGWTYAEIAEFAGIKIQTVKNTLSRLYGKSNAKNKTQLVLFWQTNQLVITPAAQRVEFATGVYPGKR